MSQIKNVDETWMAMNTFKCTYLTPLHQSWAPVPECQKNYKGWVRPVWPWNCDTTGLERIKCYVLSAVKSKFRLQW